MTLQWNLKQYSYSLLLLVLTTVILFTFLAPTEGLAQTLSCQNVLLRDTAWINKELEGPHLSKNTELSVYRFFSHKNTNQANVASYKINNQLFEPKQIGTLTYKAGDSQTSLLNHLQSFSTHVMNDVGYISKEVKDRQPKMLDNIHPEQVTFIEITEPKSKKDPDLNQIPEDFISLRPDSDRPDHVHIRKAGMWIISGQYMWPHDQKIFVESKDTKDAEIEWSIPESLKKRDVESGPFLINFGLRFMPWQQGRELIESKRMPLGPGGHYVDLDRKKFPIVYELGRAAQVSPNMLDTMLRTATTIIDEDFHVMLQGRDISQVYIFAKAMHPSRIRLFKKMGFEEFEPACLNVNNCVMVIPFKKLKEHYEIASHSYRINELKKVFARGNKAISNDNLMLLLMRAQTNFRAELDFIFPENYNIGQSSPIVVHDFSMNYQILTTAFAELTGVSRKTSTEAVDLMSQWLNGFYTATNKFQDEIDTEPFVDLLHKARSIRITNIDPHALYADQRYIPFLLIGLDEYQLRNYRELSVRNAEEILSHINPRYTIQTTSPHVAHYLRTVGFAEARPVAFKEPDKTVYTFFIERDYVLQLKRVFPQETKILKQGGVDHGFWFFRAISSNPLKF